LLLLTQKYTQNKKIRKNMLNSFEAPSKAYTPHEVDGSGSVDDLEGALAALGLPEESIFDPSGDSPKPDRGLPSELSVPQQFADFAEGVVTGPEQSSNQEESKEPVVRTPNHADDHHEEVPQPPRTGNMPPKDIAERVQRLKERVYDEAVEQNERHNKTVNEIIRDNAEGKVLVEKNTYLRGAFELGQELLALHKGKATAKNTEAHTKQLDEKKASFEALISKYENDGADPRALSYIIDTTYNRVNDPDFAPIEGTAFLGGVKVDIVNFVEAPDGRKAYKIKNEDGSIEIVYDSAVEFKRDYTTPEAEELSKFEKMKNWFGVQRKKLQEFGGSAYIGEKWNQFGNWLTNRNITEDMSEEQIQAQKQKNRRNNAIGVGAGVLAGATIAGLSIFAGINAHEQLAHAGAAGGTGTEGWGHGPLMPDTSPSVEIHTNDPSQLFPLKAEGVKELPLDTGGNAGPQIIESAPGTDLGISNSAYNVPHNGTLEGVFKGLDIDKSKLYDNIQDLATRFPGDLKRVGNDVQIRQSGLLSTELRQAIEELRNS
jgi:hypothetical protein